MCTLRCRCRLPAYENRILEQFEIASASCVSMLNVPGDRKRIHILHEIRVRANRILVQYRSHLVFKLRFRLGWQGCC